MGAMPLDAYLHREKWASPGRAPQYEWQLYFGAPDASFVKGVGISPVVYTLTMGPQNEPPVHYYPIETPEQVAVFLRDFDRFILGSIDTLDDPEKVVRALLEGKVAPFGGRTRNRIGAVQDALSVARAYGVQGVDQECGTILREEATVSTERRMRAEHVARLFHLPPDTVL